MQCRLWAEPVNPSASTEHAASPAQIELLWTAEREILACLQAGMPDKEIARQRQASINTVRNQVNAVMRKMGVHKRTQLVALGLARTQAD